MHDMNWKTWILVFVIGVGGMFELIKRLPGQSVDESGWDVENMRMGTDTANPYNVRGGRARSQAKARAPRERIAVQKATRAQLESFVAANAPGTTQFAHNDKGAEGKAEAKKKKKKKKDSEWEIFVDPVTGKKYRRRKKKAKKEEEVKQEEVAAEEPVQEDRHNNDESIEDLVHQTISSGTLPPAPQGQSDDPYANMDDWIRRLLANPDRPETLRFIHHYLDRLVSADIFYKVADMMLAHPNHDMRLLGLLCLGTTPSVMSFQVLAEVIASEPGSSGIRQSADGFMARYSDLGNLHVLERVMQSPTSKDTTLLANGKLDDAIGLHLSQASAKPPKDPAQQGTAHANVGYFSRFPVILQNLVERSTEPEVKGRAEATLARLNEILNLQGVPVTPPGQPGQPGQPTVLSQQSWTQGL